MRSAALRDRPPAGLGAVRHGCGTMLFVKKNLYENPLPPEWRERFSRGEFRSPPISEQQRADYKEIILRWDEIRSQFPGEHVAMLNGELLAHHKNWSELYRLLRAQGISGDICAIRYVSRPDEFAELL